MSLKAFIASRAIYKKYIPWAGVEYTFLQKGHQFRKFRKFRNFERKLEKIWEIWEKSVENLKIIEDY